MKKYFEINELPGDLLGQFSKALQSFATDARAKQAMDAWNNEKEFFQEMELQTRALDEHLRKEGMKLEGALLYWDPVLPLPGLLQDKDAGNDSNKPEPKIEGPLSIPASFKGGASAAYPNPNVLASFFRNWLNRVRAYEGGRLANDKTAPLTPAFWLLAGLTSKTFEEYKYESGKACCCCCCCDGGPSSKCDGEIILFEHDNFHGRHKHIHAAEPNLNFWEDNWFNDRTSSIAVLSGKWILYRDSNFMVPYPVVLGRGLYTLSRLAQMIGAGAGLINDRISSVRPTGLPENYNGFRPDPIIGHCILFEHANYLGSHKHLFMAEANLNNADESWPANSLSTPDFGLPLIHPFHPINAYFNDKASSMAVLEGQWTLFEHANFVSQVGLPVYPVGLYPLLPQPAGSPGIISSLSARPDNSKPLNYLSLFEHANFRGMHKHLLRSEDNLNRPGPDFDYFFNDRVSSVVILQGNWSFYEDAGFAGFPMATLAPGCYRFLPDWGIYNDVLSSVKKL